MGEYREASAKVQVTALDTNILLRLIAGDDHAQERAVLRLLGARNGEFFVCDVVLVELVWALGSIYEYSREELVVALEAILNRADIHFEDRIRIRRAIKHLADGGDFADFLIHARAEIEGCTALASFDRGLKKKFPNFVVVPS